MLMGSRSRRPRWWARRTSEAARSKGCTVAALQYTGHPTLVPGSLELAFGTAARPDGCSGTSWQRALMYHRCIDATAADWCGAGSTICTHLGHRRCSRLHHLE